jgi:hypothetical protein
VSYTSFDGTSFSASWTISSCTGDVCVSATTTATFTKS